MINIGRKNTAGRARRQGLAQSLSRALVPWPRFVRLHDLFTVFGDSLGGACLAAACRGIEASFWGMLDVSFCSLALYMFGAVQNDICDAADDRRLHPGRPMAARSIPTAMAVLVAAVCMCIGLLLAAMTGRRTFVVAVLIVLCTSSFNLWLKKGLAPGSVALGICRGLNIMLGMSLFGACPRIFAPVLGLAAFAAVSRWLADGRRRRQIPRANVFIPPLSLAAGWLLGIVFMPWAVIKGSFLSSFPLALVSLAIGLAAALRIFGRTTQPGGMGRYVSIMACSLIPWQGALVAIGMPEHAAAIWIATIICCIANIYIAKYLEDD